MNRILSGRTVRGILGGDAIGAQIIWFCSVPTLLTNSPSGRNWMPLLPKASHPHARLGRPAAAGLSSHTSPVR